MSVARFYTMRAAEGKADALEAAIADIVVAVSQVPGCQGATLMRGIDDPSEFVFFEKWGSVEEHGEALKTVPPGALDAVNANLAGPPEGKYLDWKLG